ncbi:hypothetical protein GCM10020001_019550 [Nonomuraea salmonea]
MLNLSIVLEDSARNTPDGTAIVFGDMRLPYSMIDTVANQVANLLVARGITKGDKVALACPNLPYFPFVYFGILKAGATVVPLNVLLQSREIAYHLDDSDAKALFCFEGTPELPLGERGKAGFEASEGCEHFFVLPATPLATESPYGESIWAALGGMASEFETVQTAPRRHGGDPLHLRHHRPAQGRRAQPPEHADERHGQRQDVPRARGGQRHLPGGAAAVPLLRPDRGDEHRLPARRDRRADAAVRAG